MKQVFKILMLLFTNSSLLAQHQNAAALTSTSLKEKGKDEEEEEERKTDKTTAELCESRIRYIDTLFWQRPFLKAIYLIEQICKWCKFDAFSKWKSTKLLRKHTLQFSWQEPLNKRKKNHHVFLYAGGEAG